MKKRNQRTYPTSRQYKFIEEFLIDQNAAQAAVRAGMRYEYGDQCLSNPNVQKEIKRRLGERAKNADITAEHVIRELWRVANSDIGDMLDDNGRVKPMSELTPDQRRAVASIDEDELFEGVGRDRAQVGVVKKIKLWPKVHALELLAKKFKLLTERVDVNLTIDLAQKLQEARLRKKDAE